MAETPKLEMEQQPKRTLKQIANEIDNWTVGNYPVTRLALGRICAELYAHADKEQSLDALVEEIGSWAEETFSQSTLNSIIAHLKREIKELADKPCADEWADCMILLFHYAHKAQIWASRAVRAKFEIIKKRDYSAEPDEEGVVEHKRRRRCGLEDDDDGTIH
jgi:NTP pyrophosphatase (non-canonical NTP hydrolase)